MDRKPALLASVLPLAAATLAVVASAEPAPAPLDLVLGTRAAIMPVHRPSADPFAAPKPDAVTGRLVYYGGRVISNVKVYAVSWGPNVNATVKSGLPDFYKAITNSAYFDWLGEYNTVGKTGAADGQAGSNQRIGHGTFGGSFTITPSVASTMISDAQIQSELAQQIAAGKLPKPDVDAQGNVNAIYMVDFPPGTTITGPQGAGTSCAQFCAYHGTMTVGGKSVPYGVLPDIGGPCKGGCGLDPNDFNNATSVHSHELVEAVTDMEVGIGGQTVGRPLAWYDTTNGEIGDICNAQQAKVGTYVVQTEWSNAKGACISVRTDLALCTGANAPCRSCTANTDCSGATPVCETDPTSAKQGQCVACAINAQCPASAPICDKSSTAAADTCRGCTANADCSQDTPVCETSGAAAGRCVQCLADSDCKTGSRCDTASTRCVECATNAQCKNPTPACNAQKQCAACTSNADCVGNAAGPICATTGACVQPGQGVPVSTPGGASSGGGSYSNGANGGGYAFPNTNKASCSASPAGRAPIGGGVAALAIALGAALRRRRR